MPKRQSDKTKEKTYPQFNCRLLPETVELIRRLAEAIPGSQADVVTRAVRMLAKAEGIDAKKIAKKKEKNSENAVDLV